MAPRRAHTKSRTGCLSCKRRRVKCDEKGPPCGPCTSRQIDCAYSQLKVPSPHLALERQPRSTNSSRTLSPHTPETHTTTWNRLLELQLMHQWSTSTYKSMTGDFESEYDTWQVILPQEGLKYTFLLDGFLALAALELAAIPNQPNYARYVSFALEYHDNASRNFRSELADITPDKQQAALAFSLVTVVLGLALPQFTKSFDEPQSLIENVVATSILVRGAGILTKQHWDQLQEAPILRNYKALDAAIRTDAPLNPDIAAAIARLTSLNEERHNPAAADSRATKLQIITDRSACQKAIFYLEELFGESDASFDRGYTLAWMCLAGKDYVAAVQNSNVVALLALMYWGVLADRCSNRRWWAKDIGKNLVQEITNVFSAEFDSNLRICVSWARKQVHL